MRLGINASFLSERPTGVGVFMRQVSSAVAALHKETYVFSSLPIETVPPDRLIRVPVRTQGAPRLSNNVCRLLYDNLVLPFRLKRRGIDVLFCPVAEFPFAAGVKLVVTVPDLHPRYFPGQFGLASLYHRISLRLLPRCAGRVVVTSDFVRREVVSLAGIDPAAVDVVPLAYDAGFFLPQPEEGRAGFLKRYDIPRPYILFVGSLFPYKNVGTLINAFLSIKEKIGHDLAIVGNRHVATGPLPEDDRIHYVDYVPSEDIPRFYSYADLLVHPAFFEGFGMTVLEAMACGAPVISSNGGSLPEVVGDAGLLFDPLDERALAGLILRVTGDDGLREDLIRKGYEHARTYSWEKTAAGILGSCRRAAET